MRTCKVGDIVMDAATGSREQYTVIEVDDSERADDPLVICERRQKPYARYAQYHVVIAFRMSDLDAGRVIIIKRVK